MHAEVPGATGEVHYSTVARWEGGYALPAARETVLSLASVLALTESQTDILLMAAHTNPRSAVQLSAQLKRLYKPKLDYTSVCGLVSEAV